MTKPFIHLSYSILLLLSVSIWSCGPQQPVADAIYYNGIVYTVDDSFKVVTAFAVKDGKVIETGTDSEILRYDSKDRTDLKGKAVYPGFHDGHCHFFGYGLDLKKISLVGTGSFESILDTLIKYRNQKTRGWIFGRGWDQNDWTVKEYPDNSKLDSLFPDEPVFLLRIDGHAALANTKAMQLAGLNASTKVTGGVIEVRNNKPTGLLIDAAVELVQNRIPKHTTEESITALIEAQKNCFEVGLTMVTDAGLISGGLDLETIQIIDSLQKAGKVHMRVNAFANINEMEKYRNKKKSWSESLHVGGFKIFGDGALGS
ncbi:MAG: amidohydrolase, partial [Bacteroidota bacterium]